MARPHVCTEHGSRCVNQALISFKSHSTQNRSFGRRYSQPTSWHGTEKLNLTQAKQTFTSKHESTAAQNKQKKTKAMFGRLTTFGLDSGAPHGRGPARIAITHPLNTPTTHQRLKTFGFCFVKAKLHYAILLANQLASWFARWSATC